MFRKGWVKMDDINFIKKHFPTQPTEKIAKKLNLTTSQVRTIAKKYHIKKCETYKKQLITNLVRHRKKWYEDNTPQFKPSFEQEQIIFGSLLGDGYLGNGGERSINRYYQVHFGENQKKYRMWKLEQLEDLGFKISGNYLRSASHPYFTQLYKKLYPNNRKSLTNHFLNLCKHPLFLATLYLDDGSLTISYNQNERTNIVYCHPSIIFYTLNFSKDENEKLANHLNTTFNTNFVVSGHPDGNGSLLKINKVSEVEHLIKIVKPYVTGIPSMKYKYSIEENVRLKKEHNRNKFGNNIQIKISSSKRRRTYTDKEINIVIQMKQEGYTNQQIADQLDRTYWSVVYKLTELRKSGLF